MKRLPPAAGRNAAGGGLAIELNAREIIPNARTPIARRGSPGRETRRWRGLATFRWQSVRNIHMGDPRFYLEYEGLWKSWALLAKMQRENRPAHSHGNFRRSTGWGRIVTRLRAAGRNRAEPSVKRVHSRWARGARSSRVVAGATCDNGALPLTRSDNP